MKDLDIELWKLGIPVRKTEHNEVAPAQHELAPIFYERQCGHRTRTMLIMDDHEEGRLPLTVWCACCMKSPLRASTAAASTTTGR